MKNILIVFNVIYCFSGCASGGDSSDYGFNFVECGPGTIENNGVCQPVEIAEFPANDTPDGDADSDENPASFLTDRINKLDAGVLNEIDSGIIEPAKNNREIDSGIIVDNEKLDNCDNFTFTYIGISDVYDIAIQNATNMGLELPIIHSQECQEKLHDVLVNENLAVAWIGLNRNNNRNDYSIWGDETNVDYQAWEATNPSYGPEFCATIRLENDWNDLGCDGPIPIVVMDRI